MTTPQNAETAWGASSLRGKRQILRRPVLVHNNEDRGFSRARALHMLASELVSRQPSNGIHQQREVQTRRAMERRFMEYGMKIYGLRCSVIHGAVNHEQRTSGHATRDTYVFPSFSDTVQGCTSLERRQRVLERSRRDLERNSRPYMGLLAARLIDLPCLLRVWGMSPLPCKRHRHQPAKYNVGGYGAIILVPMGRALACKADRPPLGFPKTHLL